MIKNGKILADHDQSTGKVIYIISPSDSTEEETVFLVGCEYWITFFPEYKAYSGFRIENGTEYNFDLTRVFVADKQIPVAKDREVYEVQMYEIDWGDGSPKESRTHLDVGGCSFPSHRFLTQQRFVVESAGLSEETWNLQPCITLNLYNYKKEKTTLKIFYQVTYPSISDVVTSFDMLDARLKNDGTVSYKMLIGQGEEDVKCIHLIESVKDGHKSGDDEKRFEQMPLISDPDVYVEDDESLWSW